MSERKAPTPFPGNQSRPAPPPAPPPKFVSASIFYYTHPINLPCWKCKTWWWENYHKAKESNV